MGSEAEEFGGNAIQAVVAHHLEDDVDQHSSDVEGSHQCQASPEFFGCCWVAGWKHREFEGHYRPPLTPQQREERDAKRLALQQNDLRVLSMLAQLGAQAQHN